MLAQVQHMCRPRVLVLDTTRDLCTGRIDRGIFAAQRCSSRLDAPGRTRGRA